MEVRHSGFKCPIPLTYLSFINGKTFLLYQCFQVVQGRLQEATKITREISFNLKSSIKVVQADLKNTEQIYLSCQFVEHWTEMNFTDGLYKEKATTDENRPKLFY